MSKSNKMFHINICSGTLEFFPAWPEWTRRKSSAYAGQLEVRGDRVIFSCRRAGNIVLKVLPAAFQCKVCAFQCKDFSAIIY